MKKTMFAIVCVIGLLMAVTNAQAISLTIGDAFYVGSINDGIPSNPADQQGYVAYLITLAKGAGDTRFRRVPEKFIIGKAVRWTGLFPSCSVSKRLLKKKA